MENKKLSPAEQKMIRDFEIFFVEKYGSLDAWPPCVYQHELSAEEEVYRHKLSKPPTLHEMLWFKEFREAVNKELEQKGKVKFA